MITANDTLEGSLNTLAAELGKLSAAHSSELQPIRAALEGIYARGIEAGAFRKNLVELAKAVIEVRKTPGISASLQKLPVPPYDLWLPFMAQSLTPPVTEDLVAVTQIFKDRVSSFVHALHVAPAKVLDPAIPPKSDASTKTAVRMQTDASVHSVDPPVPRKYDASAKVADPADRAKPDAHISKDVQSPSRRFQSSAGNQIFVSYSKKDRKALDIFKEHLSTFPIDLDQSEMVWDDTRIKAGEKWLESINAALQRATVAILLVTPTFLASDFIKKTEIPELLKAQTDKRLLLLWIHVRYSAYKHTVIADYQCLHDPNKPLDKLSLPKRNEQWVKICEQIFLEWLKRSSIVQPELREMR